MTYEEIYNILTSTGLPVAFEHWDTGQTPELPFIVFDFPRNDDFFGDDRNYVTIAEMEVYLYTKRKDPTVEAQVEEVLSQYWGYAKQSEYWDGENVQETIYMTQVVIN